MGQLILTRRIDEALVINNNIYLTVLGIKGNQVRVGIIAPKEITVDREEIHLRKKLNPVVPENELTREEKRAYIRNYLKKQG